MARLPTVVFYKHTNGLYRLNFFKTKKEARQWAEKENIQIEFCDWLKRRL